MHMTVRSEGQTFPTALAPLAHNGQGRYQERGLKHEAFTGNRHQPEQPQMPNEGL